MTFSKIHREIVEKTLNSVYDSVGDDGMMNSFIIQQPGSQFSFSGIAVEIFFRRTLLIDAAVHLRRNGPAFFRYLSLNSAMTDLRSFVTDNFWILRSLVTFKKAETSYLARASNEQVDLLAEKLAQSPLFAPEPFQALYPLVPVTAGVSFHGENFSILDAVALGKDAFLSKAIGANFLPEQFPPFKDWNGVKEKPSSWLLIKVPHKNIGRKFCAAVLGGAALTITGPRRYQFSGRHMFGGRCSFSKSSGYSVNFQNPLTPALMENIVFNADDHPWLKILDEKLSSNSDTEIKAINALQYFYRTWFLDNAERFPISCMALDSVLGENASTTESVITGVRSLLGDQVEWDRLSLLMSLRGSVIHGGAPDVYESKKYLKYYAKYGDDPISDMDVVLSECLRRKLFNGSFRAQPDPHQDIIAKAREMGRIPKTASGPSILGQ